MSLESPREQVYLGNGSSELHHKKKTIVVDMDKKEERKKREIWIKRRSRRPLRLKTSSAEDIFRSRRLLLGAEDLSVLRAEDLSVFRSRRSLRQPKTS
ncbi:hypothetical protein L6452_35701 [Arctium lappa]|uniref:Uncharacterized protein n=1 Tax=Arctium lappa TaxID=4217 RepID=A0ACB8Y6F6_ARCLA|nr:hypothetical protein L6452_35701 [Arctium lappa]